MNLRQRRARRVSSLFESLDNRRLLAGGMISGVVWNDSNSNGTQDGAEAGISGWELYLDANNSNTLDEGEVTTATDGAGAYSFTELADGDYHVRQVIQSGYRKTNPTQGTPGYEVTITAESTSTGNNFGNTTNLFLAGHVYNDANSNGSQDGGEEGLASFVINIVSNNSTVASRTTDSEGFWRVQGLAAGTGEADLVLQAGYTPTNPANAKYEGSMSSGERNGNLNFGLKATVAPSGFTPGNLVIYRVGDGSAFAQSEAVKVFLDEYTPTGTLVQSVEMPSVTAGNNKAFVASGTASSEGLLTRSVDGKYLVLTGYGAPVGTAGVASTSTTTDGVLRVIGRVGADASIDTSTTTTSHSSNNIRGIASLDGSAFWTTGGVSGVRYETLGGSGAGAMISNTINNLRGIAISNGQLYASTASGTTTRLGAIGTGTPNTTGQTNVAIPGFPLDGSPYAFFFADLDAGVAGDDTLYVADDLKGLQKFSLSGGNWTLNGTVGGDADDYRGIIGSVSGSTVTLFMTRKGGTSPTGGGELVSLVDSGGYNANFSATDPTLLATAGASMSFRGVAFTPVAAGIAAPSAAPSAAATAASSGESTVLESKFDGCGFFADA